MNKLVKWFCGQDHTVQSLLMDRFSQDDQELLVHSVLSRLAKPPPSSSSRRTG